MMRNLIDNLLLTAALGMMAVAAYLALAAYRAWQEPPTDWLTDPPASDTRSPDTTKPAAPQGNDGP